MARRNIVSPGGSTRIGAFFLRSKACAEREALSILFDLSRGCNVILALRTSSLSGGVL